MLSKSMQIFKLSSSPLWRFQFKCINMEPHYNANVFKSLTNICTEHLLSFECNNLLCNEYIHRALLECKIKFPKQHNYIAHNKIILNLYHLIAIQQKHLRYFIIIQTNLLKRSKSLFQSLSPQRIMISPDVFFSFFSIPKKIL